MIVGIIGHRSWIAKALIEQLQNQGHAVHNVSKQTLDIPDPCDVLYIFPGRARPTTEEINAERLLIDRLKRSTALSVPKHVVLISSQVVCDVPLPDRDKDEYFKLKIANEQVIMNDGRNPCTVARLPVVFGQEQPIDADFLIPSLARSGHNLILSVPNEKRWFIHVDRLVPNLIKCAFDNRYTAPFWEINAEKCQIWQPINFIGAFRMSADEMKSLVETFMFYWGL